MYQRQSTRLRAAARIPQTRTIAENSLQIRATHALGRQPYDLILMDIKMLELDGIAAAEDTKGPAE
jgi:CheY-like chemotaxis protein